MTKLGILAVIVGLGLGGCSGDKPEDVAETFVSSLSKADIQSAKDVSTEETGKKIDELIGLCNQAHNQKIIDEANMILQALRNTPSDPKKAEEVKSAMKELEAEAEKSTKAMKKKLEEKYGSAKNIPAENREAVMMESVGEMADTMKPFVSKMIDVLEIKTDYPEESTKIATIMMGDSQNTYRLINGMLNAMNKDKTSEVTPECIAKYTEYDYVDSINILEVKQSSPDKADVRLELIDKDGKSNKISVDVEKVKNEWKTARLQLDNW